MKKFHWYTKYIHIIFEIENKNSLKNRRLKFLFPIVSNTKKKSSPRKQYRSKNPFPSFQIRSFSVFLGEIEILTNTSSRTKIHRLNTRAHTYAPPVCEIYKRNGVDGGGAAGLTLGRQVSRNREITMGGE